jgi:tRNA-dihydrouridine synthase B
VKLKFDVIDINMGCPSKRITSDCAGAGALRNEDLAFDVLKVAKENAGDIPVTVKIRVGWNHDNYVHVRFAEKAQELGLSLITVHGRTADDKYSTPVNYKLIKEVVDAVDIPVIGNGDVKDGPTAVRMFEETGCAGVMVGRASQGNPWVFRHIKHYLEEGAEPIRPPFEEVLSVLREHYDMLVEDEGEMGASLQIRKLGSWYLQGYVKKSFLHTHIYKISSAQEFYAFIEILQNPHQQDCLV